MCKQKQPGLPTSRKTRFTGGTVPVTGDNISDDNTLQAICQRWILASQPPTMLWHYSVSTRANNGYEGDPGHLATLE